jgi:hypothetical protein
MTKFALIVAAAVLASGVALSQGNPGKGQGQGSGQGQSQAQGPGAGQGGAGRGQGQQTQQQKRQMERSASQDAATEHERLQQRDRDRTQQHTASGKAAPGAGIYGGNLMTEQERNQYREQLRSMKTNSEREAFEAKHREQMQQRSNERNVPIEVTED